MDRIMAFSMQKSEGGSASYSRAMFVTAGAAIAVGASSYLYISKKNRNGRAARIAPSASSDEVRADTLTLGEKADI